MAKSFYIGVPTTSVQPPVNYDSPKYIQVIGSSNSVEDVSKYYDWTMYLTDSSGVTNGYIVHHCDAQSSEYNHDYWSSYVNDGKIFVSIHCCPVDCRYSTSASYGRVVSLHLA